MSTDGIDPTDPPCPGATAPVVDLADPDRPYRRRIELRADPAGRDAFGTVDAHLEDDFHRFSVHVTHDGRVVTAVTYDAIRTPWTTCAAAGDVLQALVGAPLLPRTTDAAAVTDPHRHCTHMFDLAALAIAGAARGVTVRRFDAEVPIPVDGRQRVRLWRDRELVLQWTIATDAHGARGVLDAEPYSSVPWRGGFMRWADTRLDPDTAEAAIVLRRACDIGLGRGMPLDAIPVASEIGRGMAGVCFTMQPDQIGHAVRNRGNIKDFGRIPAALLADTRE